MKFGAELNKKEKESGYRKKKKNIDFDGKKERFRDLYLEPS